MPRKHIMVLGRVQGVGFRYHVNHLAQACHLTGWVRNCDSGEVELEVQGPMSSIEEFLDKLGRRSMLIRIDHMDVEDCAELHESGFYIRK